MLCTGLAQWNIFQTILSGSMEMKLLNMILPEMEEHLSSMESQFIKNK